MNKLFGFEWETSSLIENLNNKNRTLSDELNDLRNVAVDESIYETIDEEDYWYWTQFISSARLLLY